MDHGKDLRMVMDHGRVLKVMVSPGRALRVTGTRYHLWAHILWEMQTLPSLQKHSLQLPTGRSTGTITSQLLGSKAAA